MPSTDDDFAAQLAAIFRAEAMEHVEALSHGLLELEGGPTLARKSELLEQMFRAAHSLKGAAGAADETRIAATCQSVEGLLAAWKSGASQPAAEEIDSISKALDDVVALLEPPLEPGGPLAAGSAATGEVAPRPDARPVDEPTAPANARETTVRVAASKVDALMLQAEELLAVKLAADRHASATRDLDAETRVWRKSWQAVAADLAGLEHPSPEALRRVRTLLDKTASFAADLSSRVSALSANAEQDRRNVGPLIDDMFAQVERVLMLPFSSISALFGKMVRDLARQEGKAVDFFVSGAETEVDRRVLELLKDPLVHAIRNAVSHGIETPEEREGKGKAAKGTIRIHVLMLEESKVCITVSDDGRGLDPEGIRAAAVEAGAATREEVDQLDDAGCLPLAFRSGVSTNAIVTDISGRGVGLNVVRRNVEQIDGTVAFESVPGGGSTLRIVAPTTLATIRGVVVEIAGRPFVVPTTRLHRVIRIKKDSVRTAASQPTTVVDGQPVPLVDLAAMLGLSRPRGAATGASLQAFILGDHDERIVFRVDRVLREHDVLVKSLGPQLARVSNVSGATVLETGQVAPVLDTRGLIASASALWRSGGAARAEDVEIAPRPSVLVVEDSVTSRMLLRNILATAGFRVRTTCDGAEALAALGAEHFDAVVSDVEMPNTDGFELTARIRADERLAGLPVVLVTSRESQSDKARGIEVGANAYLVKSGFDKSDLLETLHRWI